VKYSFSFKRKKSEAAGVDTVMKIIFNLLGGGLEVQVRIEVFHTELILLKATQFIEFRWC
jgi:hypothetical protein